MKKLILIAEMILGLIMIAGYTPTVSAGDVAGLVAQLSADRHSARVGEQIQIRLLISAPTTAFSITHDPASVSAGKLIPLTLKKYKKKHNNIERQYVDTTWVLAGNNVGNIDVAAITVRATLPVAAAGINATQNPKVEVTTSPLTIAIDPLDQQYQPWFTATDVSIASHWPEGKHSLRAGVPVTRQIKITARSQLPAAIPPVPPMSSTAARVYPGVPELEVSKQADGITGIRMEPMTIMLTQAGAVTLPPVVINWWNSDTSAWQEARLPAETLQVAPGELAAQNTAPTFFKRLAIALAFLCCLMSGLVFYWWRKYRGALQRSSSAATLPLSEKDAWRNLHSALRANNYAQFRSALRFWLNKHTLAHEHLATLAPSLADNLRMIDRSRYASAESQAGMITPLAALLPQFKKLRQQLNSGEYPFSRQQDSGTVALYPLTTINPNR